MILVSRWLLLLGLDDKSKMVRFEEKTPIAGQFSGFGGVTFSQHQLLGPNCKGSDHSHDFMLERCRMPTQMWILIRRMSLCGQLLVSEGLV